MAHLTYPFTITPNTQASASQVMGNFDAIKVILNGGIDGTNLADGSVTAGKLASKAVDTSALADGAVTEGKLAAGAVATAKLADGSVTSAKLAANAVETGNIHDAAVTTAKIATESVTTNRIANGAVTSAKIGTGAVQSDKIGAAAVKSSNIALGAVQMAHLGDIWVGQVLSNGTLAFGPEGWLVTRPSTGQYTISYNLPDGNFVAFIQPNNMDDPRRFVAYTITKTALTVHIENYLGSPENTTFSFIVIRLPSELGG